MRLHLCTLSMIAAVSAAGCEDESASPRADPIEDEARAPAPIESAKSSKPPNADGDAPSNEEGDDDQDHEEPAEDGSEIDDSPETKQADAEPEERPPRAVERGAPSPPEPQLGASRLGDKKIASQYDAWLQGRGTYEVGKLATLQAVVTAKGDFKCNGTYPYKFKVAAPPSGVSFPSTTARSASVGNTRTTVTVPFTPTSVGTKTIRGTFHFSVCNESTCKIEKQKLAVTVDVTGDES